MIAIAAGCTAVISLILFVQWVWAIRFAGLMRRTPNATAVDGDLPTAAVVLAVRGADPSLAKCLQSLLQQNYPRYSVTIVVDSRDDPGWGIIRAAMREYPNVIVDVQLLEDRKDTCTLKMSALVQAVGRLGDDVDVVALIDADGEPYADWLRDLVQPLSSPGVGATTGVRWFVPVGQQWGTCVRYLWNIGALPQMHAFTIAWGGSLAFRRDAMKNSKLVDKWSKAFGEDTGTTGAMARRGLSVVTVAPATMVACESTDLASCFRFITRQLVSMRLHHKRWPVVLGMGLAEGAATTTAVGLIVAAMATGSWPLAVWMAALVAGQFIGLAVGMRMLERAVHYQLDRRGQHVARSGWRTFVTIPISQAMYWISLLGAVAAHTVSWRGINYDIRNRRQIRMLGYSPFVSRASTDHMHASVI